jgi:glycosyltransferase involved in cell wall biosynthesis
VFSAWQSNRENSERGLSLETFSVIIPNTNSLQIAEIAHALRNQTVGASRFEVLVVGSDERGVLVEDDLVRIIPVNPLAHASDKRNLGMQQAQGDLFLFLDDDCVPAPDWLEHHLARHHLGEKIVGGAVAFGARNYLQLADNVSAFHDLAPFTQEGPRPYLATANLSVRRSVVASAGEMEPHKSRAEDLEWTVRFRKCGYRLFFEPRATVLHDPARRTWRALWHHWTGDAPDTLRVRLLHSRLLGTPRLAGYRASYLFGAPFVAAWATARTFGHRRTLSRYWYTLPVVYLTKLAWCWGAWMGFPGQAR